MIIILALVFIKLKIKIILIAQLVEEGILQNGTLGSPRLIEEQLRNHYKRRKDKIAVLDKIGWDKFIRDEVNDRSGKSKVRDRIIDMINKDKTLASFTINRKILFPV